ncbi:MAG: NAD-dependent epimerase/dehydratase family protein [Actinobacteria bacterium]|nr:NAD-dependent epimerase/dehydratase family protein [Actinomycetota bacterium]
MSRILVTGATGFVGRETVVGLLRRGHEVHAVARGRGPGAGGVTWHEADLLDPESPARVLAAAQPETLLHIAWYAEHGKFWTSPRNLDWVEATLRLLHEFARTDAARRVVMAGTCAEYAWTRDRYPEDAPCAPHTLYGAAKHGLHIIAGAFAAERSLSFAWGRLFFLYGPAEAPGRFVPTVARALLAGQPASMTAGTQIRDFLHVADAGDAFAALTLAETEGPVNIASGAGVSLRDLAGLIAAAAGGAERLEIGAIPTRPDDPPSLVADVTRLRDEVGWRPRIALAEGMAATVAAWREHA